MLYVSFWNIELTNLPEGDITNRVISAEEAATLISAVRSKGELTGVTSKDLAAPYHQRAMELHKQLCELLSSRGVDVSLKDLFSDICVNPLTLARITPHSSLIVVDCMFEMRPGEPAADASIDKFLASLMQLSPDTLVCNLLEVARR